MKIKICGLRDPENIKAVAAMEPGYMGFIFYGPSPRFVGELQIEALESIPSTINKTAVFVNENAETINKIIDKYDFDFIQLHGDESPEFCKSLRDKAIVIKAFGVNNGFDFKQLTKYKNKVDMFLFDTKTDQHGGSGKTFDWSILDKYDMEIPFFLSGGISPENIEEVKYINHPKFYGIDLNSKFEISPGMKDIEKLEKAFNTIKQSAD
ncbi:phosphoribosylanthranilate isomerase [Mucilaginibacter sp. BJC16-A38]|uniref:phosphoribosylanthranilate isomerase n=1 Tax=Mucilaginibacter phenanthrenivorans TaxID=1234842 RepID=UPI0021573CBB|nr:phosphoribosylanthranilate isomerase [Mucilaginibacter phenanthrenivorans]MCR8556355.1 phosphoribosylanthranilate isomerase [Mucilaginibacter phenanthrenivorans]